MGGGNTVSFLNEDDGKAQFCCGLIAADNDTAGCADARSPFPLGSARLMYGVAGLENATLTSDDTDSSSSNSSHTSAPTATASSTGSTSSSPTGGGSCQDDDSVPIGVGVGVPLGVMALLAVAWGFWERRTRVRAQKMLTAAAVAGGGGPRGDQQQAASRSHHEDWQVPSGGYQQVIGAQVAELHSQSSPAEMTVT